MGPADDARGDQPTFDAAFRMQFDLVRLLGQRGMAKVYMLKQRFFDRHVVVEIVFPRGAIEAAAERLMRETRALAAVPHTNIGKTCDAVF